MSAQLSTKASDLAALVPAAWQISWVHSPVLPWLTGCAVRRGATLLGVAWSTERSEAAVRAVAEAFERAALLDGPAAVVTSTARDLGHEAVDLSGTLTFDRHQLASPALASFRWTPCVPVSWVPAELAGSTDRVLVPADLAYIRADQADRVRIRPATSAGTAFARTRESALDRAFAELIEAHEIAIAVAGGFPARRITPAGHGVEDLVDRLGRSGVKVHLGLISRQCCLWTVVALLESACSGAPAVAAGSAARWCAGMAARSAIVEALGSWHLGWQVARRLPQPARLPQNAAERARWWAEPAAASLLPAMMTGQGEPLPDHCGGAERAAGEHACQLMAGHQIALLDITPVEVRDGYHVARLVAPGLAPLHSDERYPLIASIIGRYPSRVSGRPVSPHPFV